MIYTRPTGYIIKEGRLSKPEVILMFGTFNTSNTIAAIATGNVISAIGIIRLSGNDAIEIASSVFNPLSGKSLTDSPDRTLVLGILKDVRGE